MSNVDRFNDKEKPAPNGAGSCILVIGWRLLAESVDQRNAADRVSVLKAINRISVVADFERNTGGQRIGQRRGQRGDISDLS